MRTTAAERRAAVRASAPDSFFLPATGCLPGSVRMPTSRHAGRRQRVPAHMATGRPPAKAATRRPSDRMKPMKMRSESPCRTTAGYGTEPAPGRPACTRPVMHWRRKTSLVRGGDLDEEPEARISYALRERQRSSLTPGPPDGVHRGSTRARETLDRHSAAGRGIRGTQLRGRNECRTGLRTANRDVPCAPGRTRRHKKADGRPMSRRSGLEPPACQAARVGDGNATNGMLRPPRGTCAIVLPVAEHSRSAMADRRTARKERFAPLPIRGLQHGRAGSWWRRIACRGHGTS